ncbi:hypothetical protein D9M71_658730 [compost metagenome]
MHRIQNAAILCQLQDLAELLNVGRVAGMGWGKLVLQRGRVSAGGGGDGSGAARVVPSGMVKREVERQNFPLRPLNRIQSDSAHGINPCKLPVPRDMQW